MFYTYIIYSSILDIYYIGSTGNLEDRLERHNSGRSKYTKPGKPWILKYFSTHTTKTDAVRLELYLKSQKSRKYLELLILNSGV